MWSGFITGFAEKSVSLIEERDKEIRKSVNSRIEDMFKRASVSKKEAEARREGLTSLANQLMGVGFSETETRALLDNPEQAESVIKLIEASPNKMADRETKRKLFAPASERMAGYAGEKPMDFIKKISTPQRGAVPPVLPTEMRGAFGLPSGAEDYVKTLGLKDEDLATELPRRGIAEPLGLDLSVFAKRESTTDIKESLRDIMARSEKTDEGITKFTNEEDEKKYDTLVKQLEASVIIDDLFEAEEKKPRSASEIRSIFKDSLREALDPYIVGGVAQVISTGDVVPITGDPKDIAKFRATRNNVIRDIAINRNLYDPRSMEVTNEEAEDALTPYATIKDGKIVGWKIGAPSITPSNTGPVAEPKNEEEYNKLPSGTRYRALDGKVKIKS